MRRPHPFILTLLLLLSPAFSFGSDFEVDFRGGPLYTGPALTIQGGQVILNALPTPGTPTVTPQGTTGATTYGYKIVDTSGGGTSAASAEGTTATGNATLSATNFNRIGWTQVTNALGYKVYRTTGGATQGLIGTITTGGTVSFDDTGIAGGGETPEATNTTALLEFEGPTADGFETRFIVTDPTADRTITFPDSSITVGAGGGLVSTDIDTSAELAAIVTDETGTGLLTFATAPTFTTSLTTPVLISGAANPADAGVMRLGNAELIAWEASPAGTDVTLTVNSGESFAFSSAIEVTGDITASATIAVNGSQIDLGTAGVQWTADGDGAMTFLGKGNGSDEDLTLNLDDTANEVTLTSSTGLVTANFSGIDLKARHYLGGGSAPTVGGSCGTGPSIVGTDTAGKVTTGTGSPTSCTVTFAVAYTNAPACSASDETTATLARATSTTTTVVLAGTFTASDVLAYHCVSY